MTVKELIENLKTYPENQKVLISGYELGYDDFEIKSEYCKHSPNFWWAGDYEKNKDGELCVVLKRKTK